MQKVSIANYKAKRASSSPTPTDPNTPAPATISASQQSYDQQIQHFQGLSRFYNQNQAIHQMKPTSKWLRLQPKQADLSAKNNAVQQLTQT